MVAAMPDALAFRTAETAGTVPMSRRVGEGPDDACPGRESRRAAAVSSSPSPFGQNEWLVEEMYRKFRDDPSSVDPSWHEFLVDYSPEPTTEAQSTAGNGQLAGPLAGQPAGPPAAARSE